MTADFVPTDTANYTSLIDVAAGSFVITKATPTATLTVSNSPQTYTGVGLAATVTLTSSVPGAVTNVRTGGAATQTTAGAYAVTADFVPTDTANYTSLIDVAAGNFVITKATPTATLTVSNSPQTYTGAGLAAIVTLTSSVPGAVTNMLTGGTATKTTAGTYAVTADFVPTDTANYTSLIDVAAGNFVITKATPTATLTVSNSPQTYTGAGLAATVTLTSSVPGTVTNILTGGAATKTTAGTYAVTADFVPTDTTNYTSLTALSAGNFVIAKATPTATLAVSNSPQTYTGTGLAATVTLTSSVPGAVTNVRTGGAATQTTAGTYAVTADFVPTDTANYSTLIDLAAGSFVITKATPTATLTVSNSPQTYTGAGLAATVTLTSSVPGTVTNILTGGAATKTTAGTYAVTADFVPTDTTNYTSLIDVAAGSFVITKATPTATLTVSNSPQTYTGVGLAATVTTSSVPGAVTNVRTGGAATQTTAGTYAVTADFVPTDTTNYTSLIDLAAGSFVITKATPTATLTVTNSPQTYTGTGLAATVTLTSSVPGAVTNVRTGGAATQTTAGTYAVTADFVPTDTTNYTSLIDVAAGNFVITKATPTATLTVSNSPQPYTGIGLAATVSVSASSVPGTVTNILTGGAATKTTAGTYVVTADFVPTDAANYTTVTALSAGNFVIAKATPTATLAVSNSPQPYTGTGLAATVGVTTSSVAGAVTNVRTGGAATQTTAGTYAVTADFVPTDTTNYTSLIDVAAGNFVIEKATPTATLTVSNSPQTYDGSAKAATVAHTSSVLGTVTNVLTGGAATQTTAGTYAVTADFVPTDTTNYTTLTGLAAGDFVITKATPTATLTVSNSPQTYTGTGLAATVAHTSSVLGAVTNVLTGGAATQTTAGTYAVTADFVPTDTTNYTTLMGLSAGNFVITKATPTATLTVSNSPQTYTGVGLAATVTLTSSVPGAVTNVRTGGAATQTTAGTYAVTADFVPTDTANYTTLIDLAAGSFVITKATPTATLTVTNSPQTYTGAAHAATVTLTSSVPGAVTNVRTGGAATQTAAGTYAVLADFVPTDAANYTSLIDLSASSFVITKATPTATLAVSNSPQTYTGTGLAATVTLTSSVPGTVTNVRTGGAATQTTAGTYAVTADFVPTTTKALQLLIDVAAGSFVITKATHRQRR